MINTIWDSIDVIAIYDYILVLIISILYLFVMYNILHYSWIIYTIYIQIWCIIVHLFAQFNIFASGEALTTATLGVLGYTQKLDPSPKFLFCCLLNCKAKKSIHLLSNYHPIWYTPPNSHQLV